MPLPHSDAEFVRLLAALPRQQAALLPALLLARRSQGFVSDEAIETIAAHLRLTVNAVEGVATAYPDLRRRPAGSLVVRVCTGLSCWTAGAEEIVAALAASHGIAAGATTADGAFTLEETACSFVCAAAPIVEIDGVCHGRLERDAAIALVSTAAADTGPNREPDAP